MKTGPTKNDNSPDKTDLHKHLESRHWKDDVFNFFDSHIRELQYGFYGLGILGCVLILKSTRVTTVFRSVQQIPERYVETNVTLQGNVRYVTDKGILLTQHQPIVKLPVWMSPHTHDKLLPVELIGIAVTPGGRKWLIDNVKDNHVWFSLIQSSSSSVQCVVYRKPGFVRKMNVNEELVRLGLGKVHFSEDQLLSDNALCGKIVGKLVKLEAIAETKGSGMWKQTTEKKTGKVGMFHKIKNIVLFPLKYFRNRTLKK